MLGQTLRCITASQWISLQAVGHIQNDRSGVLQWQPIWEALHIVVSPFMYRLHLQSDNKQRF